MKKVQSPAYSFFNFFDSNFSGRCRQDSDNNTAEILAAKFAIQQAHRLGIRNLRVYTDCNNLFDAVNGNIERWRANGWRSLSGGQPIQNRRDYEELDGTIRIVPIDIQFKLLQAHSGNEHHNAADRLARQGASY